MADAVNSRPTLNLPSGMTRDCVDPWTYLEFRPNGDVSPCCVRGPIGNIKHQPLSTIINGASVRALREQLLLGELDHICRTCHLQAATTTEALQSQVRVLIGTVVPPGGFDRWRYLLANPDVAVAGVDPTDHFLSHGRFEGRPLF